VRADHQGDGRSISLSPTQFNRARKMYVMDLLKFEGHEVRSVIIDNEVYFVAKDVFEALNISFKGKQSLLVIPEKWRRIYSFSNPSGSSVMHVINFKAVSKIAFRSNKPEADEFTNKAAEIVENVAKTGSHIETANPLVLARQILTALEAQDSRIGQLEHKTDTGFSEQDKEIRKLRKELGKKPISLHHDKEANILRELKGVVK